jgi:sensor histidine kinase YesM
MTPMKNDWVLSFFWVNLSVAIVVLVQITTNQISSVRDLWHVLAYGLIYANLTGALAFLLIGGILTRLLPRKFPLILAVAASVIVIVPLGCLLAQTLLMEIGFVVPQHFWPEYVRTLRAAMPLAVVFGSGALLHALLRTRVQQMEEKIHEKEVNEERARKLAAEAQLRSLESRIHPHFLFNALNSISSLIAVNPTRAELIVGRLAALLRASLDTGNQPLISLKQELAIVESYLDIEKARFGDKLRGSVNVPMDLQDSQVPPMSVQLLVENAVKHGITPRSGGGELLVTASAEDGSLRVEVRDNGPGFDLSAIRAGHGLDNLVERLNALFDTRARLNVLRRDGYSVVEMVLPRT